jgi:hypothetical protein
VKRRNVPGLVDVFEVTDPAEINALAHNPSVDRQFDTPTCPVNWLLLARALSVLSFRGRRFPTMMPRSAVARARDQDELWNRLSEKASAIRNGPEELEPLANWVRGVGADADLGMLVQQLLGRLFSADFQATPDSWRAAETLVAAPRLDNWATLTWWFVSGKVRRAKELLAGMVHDDLSGVNAIGISVHNAVKSIRHLRQLYAAGSRSGVSPESAAEQSLFAPASVFRQSTESGTLGDCPFPRHALFVFALGEASQRKNGRSLVFMDETWSRCPAHEWVPAMLQGVWKRACM